MLAQNGLPAPVQEATQGPVVVLQDVGKKNTFIIQTAPGTMASVAKTDNTGRNASQGANGGQSVVESSGPGLGTFVVVATLKLQLGDMLRGLR